MSMEQERAIGLELAKAAGAEQTLAAIKNDKFCYEAIFKTALQEKGLDALVSNILQGPAEWSSFALQHLHDLGPHREALAQRAASIPPRVLNEVAAPAEAVESVGSDTVTAPVGISSMSLNCQAIVVCNWTVNWQDGGIAQPAAGVPQIWTSNLTQYKSNAAPIVNFTLTTPASPLSAGDEVWMYVYVRAGYDVSSQPLFNFTYAPNLAVQANLVLSGTTSGPVLSLGSYS